MNRASLLHILDHASGISEAEVRELEQLAAAFPYCQTAHLLLAKAAHDRGSMLAGQRLRRAATYAADRELLRTLIELRPPVAAATSTPVAAGFPADSTAPTAAPVAAQPVAEPFAAAEAEFTPVIEPEELPAEAPAVALSEEAAPFSAPHAAAPETTPVETEEPEAALPAPADSADTDELTAWPSADVLPPEAAAEPESAEPAASEDASTGEEQPADLEAAVAAETQSAGHEEALAEPALPAVTASPDEPAAVEQPTLEADAAENLTQAAAGPESTDTTPLSTPAFDDEPVAAGAAATPDTLPGAAEPDTAEELPAAAPPIRPPVEAGSSRFEFGLGDAPETGPAYQLPELPEAPPSGGIPAYRADELLAYALSSGSRFGAALTLRDAALTTDQPTADAWHPDAAVLAHYAAHRPAAPVVPSSLALIDKFLRSQPRIKTAQRPAPTDAPQADLSVRSTSAAPSLASESLAKIMVKQGKIERAIEIYEQLMQRQPEKKAYFAAQIDLLNQQPE